MSLILEALKKLERDKQVPDRGGFLVMAARPWPSGDGEGRRLFFASLGLAAFGFLGLAVAGVWWWQHRESPTPTFASAPTAAPPSVAARRGPAFPAAPAAPAVAPAAPAQPARVLPPVHVLGASPREVAPQAPVTAAPSPPAEKFPAAYRLTAISERDGKRLAILNERTVYEGDSFEGVKVIHIGDNEIELDVNGHRETVKF